MNELTDLMNELFEPLSQEEQAMLIGANTSITISTTIIYTNGVTPDTDADVEYDNDFSN